MSDETQPTPGRKFLDYLTIFMMVLVVGAVLAAVITNVRSCVLNRSRDKHGWNVDDYIAEASSRATDWQKSAVLTSVWVDYVDSDGNAWLADDSNFQFSYDAHVTGSGPAVQVGAEAATDPTCGMRFYIHNKRYQLTGHMRDDGNCDPIATPQTCTVAKIWKRAIAKGAPANALATIELTTSGAREWKFTITDHTAKKTVAKYRFPDDCD